MADCTGYGFSADIMLCVSGPITDTETADLIISFSDVARVNFDSSQQVTVPNWDGREVSADITSLLRGFSRGYEDFSCDLTANVTITPSGSPARVNALLEFTLSNCNPAGQGAVLCGGVGPHVISDMRSVNLTSTACV